MSLVPNVVEWAKRKHEAFMRWMTRIAWVAEPQAREDDLVWGVDVWAAATVPLHRPGTIARHANNLMEVWMLLKVVPKVIL